ncbi:MAG: hypothetical protein ABI561_10165 [Bradyrhizobium sp.]
MSQVQRCWKKPKPGADAAKVEAAFSIRLTRDGKLEGPPVPEEVQTTPYQRLLQESGLRALVACQPYQLPADYFEEWKHFAPVFTDLDSQCGNAGLHLPNSSRPYRRSCFET